MTADTVLIVTASYDVAADYVLKSLQQMETLAFRLNTDYFPSRTQASFYPPHNITFTSDDCVISNSNIKSVWYRRHVLPELPKELESGVRDFCERETRAFLDGVLASLTTERFMSPPLAIVRAERKPYQLSIASELGFKLPNTIITNNPIPVVEMAQSYQLVAKAVSSGYIVSPEGNRAIFTSKLKSNDIEDLGGLVVAPVTFQELIDKVSDIRVTVVGEEVFAAEILSQESESSKVDWRATDNPLLVHRVHKLPEKITDLCRKLVINLGLSFGAIDLALKSDGSYVFLEINPNGEWVWLEDQLGFPISDRIAQWLDKA